MIFRHAERPTSDWPGRVAFAFERHGQRAILLLRSEAFGFPTFGLLLQDLGFREELGFGSLGQLRLLGVRASRRNDLEQD